MKPFIHAVSSAKKYGGLPEDYIDIHNWFDQTKALMADARHRALLHSAFGIFLCEQMFGFVRRNSDNKTYCVRDIAEQHVLEDLGFIPSAEQWLGNIKLEPWMQNGKEISKTKKEFIDFKQVLID